MGKFQARSVAKGDYDGIRKQIVEVLDQPGYDDGMWICLLISSQAPQSKFKPLFHRFCWSCLCSVRADVVRHAPIALTDSHSMSIAVWRGTQAGLLV